MNLSNMVKSLQKQNRLGGNMVKLTTTKKKLTPASIISQKKWSGFPVATKKKLRKTLKDADKDGVPNKYDCHPKNKRKQESFLSQDAAYLNSNDSIKLGTFIDNGSYGSVYFVKDNDNLIVKLPMGFADDGKLSRKERKYKLFERGIGAHQQEINAIRNFDTNSLPLFAPSKIVNMGRSDISKDKYSRDKQYQGIIHPTVTPAGARSGEYKLSDAQLAQIRKHLIQLSYKGIYVNDHLQIGVDKAGRLLIYDLGFIEKEAPSIAFRENDRRWVDWLFELGKVSQWCYDNDGAELKKYGRIEP